MNIKHVKVEYIENGTFQGGEEDTSKAGINYGEGCIVISKDNFNKLKKEAAKYKKVRDLIISDKTGGLDLIVYQIDLWEKK